MSKHLVDLLVERSDEFSFCFTIVNLDDPRKRLLFVNKAYEEMTGYSRREAVGRNCKFMQGPDTSQWTVERIRRRIQNGEACFQDILNYRKDRTPFWNRLILLPLVCHQTQYYVGIQNDVTEMVCDLSEEERDQFSSDFLKHMLGNPLNVILQAYDTMRFGESLAEETREDALLAVQNGIQRINDFVRTIHTSRAGFAGEDWKSAIWKEGEP